MCTRPLVTYFVASTEGLVAGPENGKAQGLGRSFLKEKERQGWIQDRESRI